MARATFGRGSAPAPLACLEGRDQHGDDDAVLGMLAAAERRDKMCSLVRGYFASGGMEVQFNVVDNATLRDAQRHPERYRDLVVRVSGYSAFFTDLGRAIQDELISRTVFGSEALG